MILSHIFDNFGPNLFYRIPISVHCDMLNDEEGQILQVH